MVTIPAAHRLHLVLDSLAGWQRDDAPIQLHPGDVGWAWVAGADAVLQSLRAWWEHDRPVAIGLQDGPALRLTVAPDRWRDEALADRIVADLPAVEAVEAPDGTRVRELLHDRGWTTGESWTPLQLHLTDPVPSTALDVQVVSAPDLDDFLAVHQAAWDSSRFDRTRWQQMAGGPLFDRARCLLGRSDGVPVAGITVWSAGTGRPGLIEPLGVHPDHRRLGHGREITLAGASQLRELGASSVLVCTQTALTSAVATYVSAGFALLPQRLDRVPPPHR